MNHKTSPRDFFVNYISERLGVPEDTVAKGLVRPFQNYRKIVIKKNNGGNRIIFHPAVELKMIQSWLINDVFSLLPVSKISMAYRKGVSILDNANLHKNFNYMIRVDIQDFFGSIRVDDLRSSLEKNKRCLPGFVFDNGFFEEIVVCSCFSGAGSLPVGYLSSPVISNIVMKDWDENLFSHIESRFKGTPFCLTRYADDFVFSTDIRGGCYTFFKIFNEFCSSNKSPSLIVNQEKTRYMSKKGRGAFVTGLRINKDSHVGVHKNYKSHLKLLLKLYKNKKISNRDDISALPGHLSFVKHVDPSFFTKLCFLYFDEIDLIMKGQKKSSYESES